MFTIAVRFLTASVAASALVGAWLWSRLPSSEAADLGTVLTKTAASETLQLELTRDGKTGEVWVRDGKQLRWNLPDGTYQIAQDGKAWLVDEKANRASLRPAAYLRGDSGRVDLLALLGLSLDGKQNDLLAARPAEREDRDGRAIDVYRWETSQQDVGLRVEAVVDAKSQMLQSLEAVRVRGDRTEAICRLAVTARDKPVNEDLFVVGDTLTEDGRIGKVTDVQGLVTIRPVMHQRWSPVAEHMPLGLGDWLQTDPRGANAVSVRLAKETDVVIGPGSTLELANPRQIRISDGEIKIKAQPKSPVELIGPQGKKLAVEGTQLYRVQKQQLVKLDTEPPWLRGYEGKTANESIGSLVTKIDGRNVPLTVGYHKVVVDIRDQIARTTIEESFVNHTEGQLEGVFHFPLPQDASIAGFGMWIDDKLVEADVVEKERAREIYETILREKRDPGLLEWAGGNIFKARVFPILPHSEKRITISYTQVIPLRGNAYRYQYALQSELLKQHPLMQLEIDVKVNSAAPLKAVASPTHATRNALTAHSAHVEFSAKEYTPTQDFEVVVEVDGRQSDVVLIPHRRGDDGYFMVQLTPPCGAGVPPADKNVAETAALPAGQWQRDVLSDGEALELLILADTSASMDRPSRDRQAELVGALLTSLTAKDKFNLGTCDVDCQWVFAKPAAADAKNIELARQRLAAQKSLGWTDLDKAIQSVLAQYGPKTQVVYIGDGIVTAPVGGGNADSAVGNLPSPLGTTPVVAPGRRGGLDTDPVAFAKRLRRMAEGKPGTFHAVATSSGFEPGVVRAIASLGGGSFRQVSGSHGPAAVALELLEEITQPTLRDLKVEFRGIRAARVYPEQLPNLAPGTQQIILGRYLPEGKNQAGEVIVTGTQAGKPVKFTAKVSLNNAEEGNSFIPRLWARMHLDVLLEQGASPAIKDEIVALSEEYHIITPYTSLLVLETDADRERFGVKRRFQMRDGEKFFAQGRENANWELIQQQMKRAGTWRLGLRRDVLRQLSTLGRIIPGVQGGRGYYGQPYGRSGSSRLNLNTSDFYLGDLSVGRETTSLMMEVTPRLLIQDEEEDRLGIDVDGRRSGVAGDGGWDVSGDFDGNAPIAGPEPAAEEPAGAEYAREDLGKFSEGGAKYNYEPSEGAQDKLERFDDADLDQPRQPRGALSVELFDSKSKADAWYENGQPSDLPMSGGYAFHDRRYTIGKPVWETRRGGPSWLSTLFPALPSPPTKPREPKKPWPAEARAIARSLLRTEQLTGVKDGLRIEIDRQSLDTRWNELATRSHTTALVSPNGWLTVSEGDGMQTSIAWSDVKERGAIGKAFLLGRVRPAKPADMQQPPIDLGAGTAAPLDLAYPGYSVEVRPEGKNRTLLVLKHPNNLQYEIGILVDTARHVVLKIENSDKGRISHTTNFGDFVEVAGAWYAGRIESVNAEGRRSSLITHKLTALAAGDFNRQWKQELAVRDQSQILREPLPRLVEAKKAMAAGKATFEDQIVLLLHFHATQQWDRVLGHLDAAEKLSGKPGMRWVRTAVLQVARRAEEAKKRCFEEAAALAQVPLSLRERVGVRGPEEQVPPDLFLADYLVQNASQILEANEMLRLLDVLKPVYERQPAYVRAMRRWNQERVNRLEQTGQTQEVLKLRRQLAQDFPHDYDLQRHYAQALANAGEHQAAYEWLDRVLAPQSQWLPYEEEYLRVTYAELLRGQGRYNDVVEYLGAYVKRDPPSQNAYAQYLSALVWDDRLKQADELIAQWIKDGQRPDELAPAADARLRAAVAQALGQGHNLWTNRIDDQWFKPLADTAIHFARHASAASVADQITSHNSFQQSDECRRVRKWAAGVLRTEIDKLTPEQIERLVRWISPNDPAVEKEVWKQIAAGVRRRWDAEAQWEVKNRLGSVLAGVLSGHVGPAEWIDFLRTQLKGAPEEYRVGFTRQLFDALLGQPWTQAQEDEAFTLLEQISDAELPSQRLAAQIAAVCQMTDRMVQARFQARMKAVERPEKLTRTELRVKQEENLRLAREGYADRLQKEMAKHQGRLVHWMNVERVYLDVLAERKLDKVAEECWEFLGAKPTGPLSLRERARVRGAAERSAVASSADPTDFTPALSDDEALLAQQLGVLLQQRWLITVMNLAARKGAKPALADRVLGYLETGAKAEPDQQRWKLLQYQMLVALDRPKDLAQRLKQWIAGGEGDSPLAQTGTVPFSAAENLWRMTLGYLEAETGRIAEAIQLFEAVRAADELRGPDYRTLAEWYMVVGRRDAYDRARIDAMKATGDYRLSRWLDAKLRPWLRRSDQQQPPPRELDVEVLLAFTALFEKASQPQNYLYQVRQFYEATRDFRLLAGLADAVVGHTAGQVYPFLQNMSPVLSEVRDEATCDTLVEQIAQVRNRAKTVIDQRALDLLETLVERRAAELKNQPGPHTARALGALQRAWKREWSPGEPRLMADLLASLGSISQRELADEQVRELESLHRDAMGGTEDRLFIAYALARTHWSYARHDRAIDLLAAALDEYQAASQGRLPTATNNILSTLVTYLEDRTQHARGEKLLQEQIKHPANQQQVHWLTQRLYQLYESAISRGGDVSLGSGAALYRAVQIKLQQDLETRDQNHRYALVNRLCSIYRAAHAKKLPEVAADLRRFAFERLPVVLKRQTNNYTSMVSETANALHDIAGARDGLAFLIRRIETEPGCFRFNNQDGWSQYSDTLGRWRTEVKDLGELDKPLLAIVTGELRRDLHSRQQRSRTMYHRHWSYFWAEKEADFAKTADGVWAQDKQSGAACAYIADYLYHGLNHYSRAIEILLDAHRREVLDESGQSTLVQYVHWQSRFAESIPILEALVVRRPDNLQYRVWLMHAYFKTKQPQRLADLLKKTHDYFHQENRWQENAMAMVGRSCLENELYRQSADYLQEAIQHRQRTAPRRGIGDGVLSGYYGDQARAYAGLKKTSDAVEAASAAVVAWGHHISNRADALNSLKAVLRAAPDLDAYVVHLDKRTAESRLENPIVRKAIGQVYLERNEYSRAIRQLRLAGEVQPNDAETHKALLACYEKQNDQQGAVEALLRWRDYTPRDIKLYEDIGNRLQKLGQAAEAERAYTSIVEALPTEAESHQLLAEARQRQDRWGEAAVQWEEVARIRSLEPTGLLGLADALIHQGLWAEAGEAVAKLKQKTWPARFENLHERIRELEKRIEQKGR